MAGVQFITKQAVLDAYTGIGGTWALFQGKVLRIAGADETDLSDWIDRFSPAGSTATYTLRLYGDMDPADVRPNTDYSSSFDLKIDNGGGGVNGFRTRLGDRIEGMMIQKFEELEKRMDEKDEEPEFDLTKVVMGWLQEPSKIATVIGAVSTLIQSVSGFKIPVPAPAAVGAFDQQQNESSMDTELTPEQEAKYNRLSVVLDRLEKRDPKILDHLEKLADIAEKKPDTFAFLLQSLNNMAC